MGGMMDFQRPDRGKTSYSLVGSFFDGDRALRIMEARTGIDGETWTGVLILPPTDADYPFWSWLRSDFKNNRGWLTVEEIDALKSKFKKHQKWARIRNWVQSMLSLHRSPSTI
jgi:hypothetical protein